MTSVPRPLKFMRTHYVTMKQIYERIRDPEVKRLCADIISVLGMTAAASTASVSDGKSGATDSASSENSTFSDKKDGVAGQEKKEGAADNKTAASAAADKKDNAAVSKKADNATGEIDDKDDAEKRPPHTDTLHYRFLGSEEEVGSWGHEYVRHLVSQLVFEWHDKELSNFDNEKDKKEDKKDKKVDEHDEEKFRLRTLHSKILLLVRQIIPYLMQHNAEPEAIDLAIEIEHLSLLHEFTGRSNYNRVCLYLVSCVPYLTDWEKECVLRTAADLYEQFGDVGQTLRCLIRLNDPVGVIRLFRSVASAVSSAPKGTKTPESAAVLSKLKQMAFLVAKQRFPVNDGLLGNVDDATTANQMDTSTNDDQSNQHQSLTGSAKLDLELADIINNTLVNENFLELCRDLDIMEPKQPEDIYKTHLDVIKHPMGAGGMVDSARANLSNSYVNGLINCGFGKDKLIMQDDGGGAGSNNSNTAAASAGGGGMKWVYKHKEIGKMSAVATLGWILQWDLDSGLTQIDKYLYSSDEYIKAGGLLACGIVNSGVTNECDPAFALLSEYVSNSGTPLATASIIGIGLAYAGTNKTEPLQHLEPIILRTDSTKFNLACLAALSSGMIAVASLNPDVITTIIETMLTRPSDTWNSPFTKFMILGLGLVCLGRQDSVDVVLASVESLHEPIKSMAHLMCDICAYAGSGNVLKIQSLLHILSEKYEDQSGAAGKDEETTIGSSSKKTNKTATGGATDSSKKSEATAGQDTNEMEVVDETKQKDEAATEDNASGVSATSVGAAVDDATEGAAEPKSKFEFIAHQGIAALGVGLIAMGEDIGMDMAFRIFGHLLRFGESPIKRAVPLSLALCYLSNPQLKALDMLSKFSHDADHDLSCNAILAMGLCGAGTNNARLAAMLRQLAMFHAKDNANMFMVRLAQGLTHLGKGTMTLSPFHSDRFLMSPAVLSGILTLCVACLDVKKTLLAKHDYLLFYLTPSIQPRLLMTFNEDLAVQPVSVRVGQAVDVVGQAGKPKTITGFQTHTTPVLLAHGERAELTSDEYLTSTNLPLEGFVVLRKNPEHESSANKTENAATADKKKE